MEQKRKKANTFANSIIAHYDAWILIITNTYVDCFFVTRELIGIATKIIIIIKYHDEKKSEPTIKLQVKLQVSVCEEEKNMYCHRCTATVTVAVTAPLIMSI